MEKTGRQQSKKKRAEEEAERNKVPTITTLCNVCRDRERETERERHTEIETEREKERHRERTHHRASAPRQFATPLNV